MRAIINFLKLIIPDFKEYNNYAEYVFVQLLKGKVPQKKYSMWRDGDWLSSHRKQFEKKYHKYLFVDHKRARVFIRASKVNLENEKGYNKYDSFFQRSAFYKFVDYQLKLNHTEVRWFGTAADTVTELSFFRSTPKFLNFTNREINKFIKKGNVQIFQYMWPFMQQIIDFRKPVKGADALELDALILAREQVLIQPLYDNLTEESLDILQKGLDAYSDSDDLEVSTRTAYGRWYYGMYSEDKMNYETLIEMPEVGMLTF